MSNREIKVVISAKDEYSAQLNRFNQSLAGVGTSVGKAEASTAGFTGAINGLRGAWMQMGAIIAAAAWFVSATKKAGEAEEAYNKLRLQVEALGMSYNTQRQSIEGAINAASAYAIVQDEDVAAVLQQMILHSGNYEKSLENLNLVYDLAYMKNISAAEAATVVGKAISGNIESLSRLFPELKDVNERLGEHATKSEKAAYGLQFFNEKVKGTKQEMTQYSRDVAQISAAYEALHQTVGKFTARGLANTIDAVKNLRFLPLVDEMAALDRMAHAINKNNVVTSTATDIYKKGNDAVMESVASRGKSLAVLEQETKARSDAAEAETKATEQRKKAREAAAKEEQENYKTAAAKIIEVETATEKLTASKERLIQLDAIAFASKGATTKQLEQYISALEKQQATEAVIANAKIESDQYRTAAEQIIAVETATERLTASRERLIELDAIAFASKGATTEQLDQYILALKNQQTAEDEAAARKEKFTALAQLTESDRESPYKPQEGEGGQLGDAYAQYQGGDQLAALQDYNTQRMQLMVDAGKSQYEIEAEYERLTTQMKDREYQMRLGAASQFAGGMSNFFQNLYTASGKKNKALFEMAKAFSIAEAVMNTAKAATQALAFPPGPPISFAYVAAAIAAGAAQIATIASSKPGGSGGAISAGGYATPAYSGGSASAQPVPMRLEEDSKPPQTITVIINNPLSQQNWEKITQDNIIPAINAAGDRNVKISINAVEGN